MKKPNKTAVEGFLNVIQDGATVIIRGEDGAAVLAREDALFEIISACLVASGVRENAKKTKRKNTKKKK